MDTIQTSNDDDLADLETSVLIAKLTIEDIEEIDSHRKGKGRADAPLTDEELALQIQAQSLHSFLVFADDHRIALSNEKALRTDQGQITAFRVLDQAEHDDHQAALVLHGGGSLPPPTVFQQTLEKFCYREKEELDESDPESDDSNDTVRDDVPRRKRNTVLSIHFPSGTSSHRECIICGDTIKPTSRSFHAPCNHWYCRECLVNLVEVAIHDESLFPVRCCRQSFSIDDFKLLLTFQLRIKFKQKSIEFSTPAESRIYCTKPTCSAFLGKSGEPMVFVCHQCHTMVCSKCRNEAHPNGECEENKSVLQVQALAADKHWQTCPGCHNIVELSQGCYHMTCRCSTQFCYLCAARWKTCGCVQWDENRLLDDAHRRVLNEYGEAEAERRPNLYAERVQHRMGALRVNHVCDVHTWRYRPGGGPCEQCNYNLPNFLLRCRDCQMLVCKRCSVNRL